MATKYKLFSKMSWLDEEIKRNEISIGRNSNSDFYYSILLDIRNAQEDGTIEDDLYSRLSSWMANVPPEEGYYYSNIHYDLYEDSESTDSIEDRILHFLDVSDPIVLKNSSRFELNFIGDLRYFMSQRYNLINDGDNDFFFNEYGNLKERKIYKRYKNIINRDRPIIYGICLDFYDLTKRVLNRCDIKDYSVSSFKIKIGKDGRKYKKSAIAKYKDIDIHQADYLFDSIYKLTNETQYVNKIDFKNCNSYLEVKIKTIDGEIKYLFEGNEFDKIKEEFSNDLLVIFN